MSEIPENGLPGGDQDKPPSYRVLTLDADQNVSGVMHIKAADDASAKAVAERLAKECATELWDGLRFIEHFEPGPNSPAQPQS